MNKKIVIKSVISNNDVLAYQKPKGYINGTELFDLVGNQLVLPAPFCNKSELEKNHSCRVLRHHYAI